MADFNIGKDITMTFLVAGQPIGALAITSFDKKQVTKRAESDPINGEPQYLEIEKGWEGSFEWDRRSPILDVFFAQKEAALYAGGTVPAIVITERIREKDGSNSRWRYTGVTVKLDEGGAAKADDKVMQRVGWISARRIQA